MAEQKQLPQSLGFFEARGIITVVPENSFQTGLKGKNNPDYHYSRINLKMEDDKGGQFWLNAMDGFNITKGRKIFANIKDGDGQLEIQFADRNNAEILKNVDDRSFIKIGLRKVKNEEGKDVWETKSFLTLFDVIAFLKDRLQTGMKLYVRGRAKYSMYNDNLQKDYDIQSIYILPEDDDRPLGFTFNQNVLLTSDSVDDSKWEDEGVINLASKLYLYKSKDKKGNKEYQVLQLPLIVRAEEGKKEQLKRMVDKFLKVDGDTVRRIRLEGKYNVGFVAGSVTEDDLPEEAKELIEDGLYTLEEVMKLYANRERVDEMLVTRPVIIKPKSEGEKPSVDYDDKTFTLEDFENLIVEVEPEVSIDVASDDDDLSFLEELE